MSKLPRNYALHRRIGVIKNMNSLAKQQITCDSCRAALDPKQDIDKQNIQAILQNSKGEPQKLHYCNEACMLAHLKDRDKRRRAREAKGSYGLLEVDFSEEIRHHPSEILKNKDLNWRIES